MKQTDAFPNPPSVARVTLALPVDLAERIDRLADRLKVSRSAFVAELLAEPIAAMVGIIDLIPETGATHQDVKRAKGRSVDLIRTVVAEAVGLLATEAKGPDASQAHGGRRRRPPTPKPPQKPVRKRASGRRR